MKVNRIKIRMIYKIMSEKSFSSSLTPFIQTRPGARFLLIQGKTTVPLVRKKGDFPWMCLWFLLQGAEHSFYHPELGGPCYSNLLCH